MMGFGLRAPAGPAVLVACDEALQPEASRLVTALGDRHGVVATVQTPASAGADDALALSLSRAEASVLLLTAKPDLPWRERWFRQIQAEIECRPHFPLVVVVVGPSPALPWLADWAYLGLPDGLDAAAEDVVGRACGMAIETLPLSAGSVFGFDEGRAIELLVDPSRGAKRWVIDPLRRLDTLVARALAASGRPSNETRERLAVLLNGVDRLAPFYFGQVRDRLRGHGHNMPRRALKSIGAFARIALGQWVVEQLTRPADAVRPPALDDEVWEARRQIEERRVVLAADGFAEFTWALGVSRDEAERWFADLVLFGAGGRDAIRAWMPVYTLGERWRSELSYGAVAQDVFHEGDWVDYGMPQVALRVMLEVRGGADVDEAIGRFSWSLPGYGRIGEAA